MTSESFQENLSELTGKRPRRNTGAHLIPKPEAVRSSVNALAEYLGRIGCEGSVGLVPERVFMRVCYDMPQPRPFVSLMADFGKNLASAQNLEKKMVAAHCVYPESELVMGYDNAALENIAAQLLLKRIGKQPFITAYPLDAANPAERLNRLAGLCSGQVLGVMGKNTYPMQDGWLEELVSRLCLPGVGVIGSRIVSPSGRIVHAGYDFDAAGRLAAMFSNLPRDSAGYFGWPYLARTVAAVDGLCLFTKARDFTDAGGFHVAMGEAWAFDYCLRLKERHLRTVVSPFADCITTEEKLPWLRGIHIADTTFSSTWEPKKPPEFSNTQTGM